VGKRGQKGGSESICFREGGFVGCLGGQRYGSHGWLQSAKGISLQLLKGFIKKQLRQFQKRFAQECCLSQRRALAETTQEREEKKSAGAIYGAISRRKRISTGL